MTPSTEPKTVAEVLRGAAEKLGPFGHHPDPSTDYCIEVEDLEGYAYELSVGLNHVPGQRSQWPFWARLSAALKHTLPADDWTPGARETLTHLEARARGLEPHPFIASAADLAEAAQ